MRLLLATAVALVAAGTARAQETPAPLGTSRNADARVVVMGQPLAFVPFELPVNVVCDDLSVLSVADAGTFLRLTGLKPGATDCSFSSLRTPGRRFVYRFVVVP